MGTIRCPLCCQRDFSSASALHEHLLNYIFQPLHCDICQKNVDGGIQELMRHLECHFHEELIDVNSCCHLQMEKNLEQVPEVNVGREEISLPNLDSTLCCEASVQSEKPNQIVLTDKIVSFGNRTLKQTGVDVGIRSKDICLGDKNTNRDTRNGCDRSQHLPVNTSSLELLKLRQWQLEKTFTISKGQVHSGNDGTGSCSSLAIMPDCEGSTLDKNETDNIFSSCAKIIKHVAQDGALETINVAFSTDQNAQELMMISCSSGAENIVHSAVSDTLTCEGTKVCNSTNQKQVQSSSDLQIGFPKQVTSCQSEGVVTALAEVCKAIDLKLPIETFTFPSMCSTGNAELTGKSIQPKPTNVYGFAPHLVAEDNHEDVTHLTCETAGNDCVVVPTVLSQFVDNRCDITSGEDIVFVDSELQNFPVTEGIQVLKVKNQCMPKYKVICPSSKVMSSEHVESTGKVASKRITADNQPYLHKKFHHDRERLTPSSISDKDCARRFFHGFQSMLVSKLNSTMKSVYLASDHQQNQNLEGTGFPKAITKSLNPYEPFFCMPDAQKLINIIDEPGSVDSNDAIKDPQSTFSCVNCTVSFSDKPSRDMHERMHHPDINLKHRCDFCNKTFSKVFNLRRHQREVHKNGPNGKEVCNVCMRSFGSKRLLQNHLGIHATEKKFSCGNCSKTYSTSSGLRSHRAEAHKMDLSLPISRHQCTQCQMQFTKVFSLKRHCRIKHEGVTKSLNQCLKCPKTFSCQGNLERHHQKVHNDLTTIKSVACPYTDCHKSFSSIWALKRHSASTHQEEVPRFARFVCHKCQTFFSRSDSLANHLKTHNHIKSFSCSRCGKRFMRMCQLCVHQDKHSEVSKYQCHSCGTRYKFKVSLKNHICPSTVIASGGDAMVSKI